MGGGAVLSLRFRGFAERWVCCDRRERDDRHRPDPIPQCRRCGLPVTETRAQGDVSEGDQQGSGRRSIGFGFGRSRLLLLTGATPIERGGSLHWKGKRTMKEWVRW